MASKGIRYTFDVYEASLDMKTNPLVLNFIDRLHYYTSLEIKARTVSNFRNEKPSVRITIEELEEPNYLGENI